MMITSKFLSLTPKSQTIFRDFMSEIQQSEYSYTYAFIHQNMARLGSFLAVLITSLLAMSYFGGNLAPLLKAAEAQVDESKNGANWIAVDYDRMATQFNPQTQINKQNVNLLELKYIFPFPQAANIGGYTYSTQIGSIATPLVVDGIVYLGTNFGRVFAVDAGTGKQVWAYTPEVNFTRDIARGVIIGAGAGAGGLGAGHTHGISYAEGKLFVPMPPCDIHVIDALTGKKIAQIADMCVNIPGREQLSIAEQQARGLNVACSGNYKGAQSYGPSILQKERVLIVPAGAVDESSRGARGFFAGYDMDNYQLLWRFFLTPPHGGDPEWTVRVADKGWIQGVKASTIPREALLNDWGNARCVQTGPGWGQYAFDQETGIVYVGTTQPAPDYNATYRPGPNVFSASIVALKARTGELVWWHQSTTHDLWDWDCAWNTVFAKINFGGQIGEKKAVFKGCKNGIVYMLDAATGQIIWTFNPPSVPRCAHCPSFVGHSQSDYKQIPNSSPPAGSALKSPRDGHNIGAWDPKDPDIYKLRWWDEPDNNPVWINPNQGQGAIEADVAFDGKIIYVGTYNRWSYVRATPVDRIAGGGAMAVTMPESRQTNATLYALDAATGKVKWSFFMDGVGFRSGNTVSGGLVYAATADGNLRAVDTDTGKLVWEKFFGGGLNTPPVIAADAKGKMRLFQLFGQAFAGVGTAVPGGLMVFALPDKLPEPQVITKEVIKEVPKEVIKEVIKEVPKEVIKEVIKEVPKEVIRTVTIETISPLSYALVGVSVVVLVVAAVLVNRRRKA